MDKALPVVQGDCCKKQASDKVVVESYFKIALDTLYMYKKEKTNQQKITWDSVKKKKKMSLSALPLSSIFVVS